MEATLYPQEKKPIPWQLIGRVAVAVFAMGVIIAGVALRSYSIKRARAFETLADVYVVRTGLAQYFLARSAYPTARAASVPLGVGEALCLDDSLGGFQFACSGQVLVAVLPRPVDASSYLYSKTDSGYSLNFVLSKAIGAWRDANRDGRVLCTATESAVSCQ